MKKVNLPSDIMQRIADGDDAAVKELYYATYKPLFAFILSNTCNYSDAEDILQETYIKVIESAHLYHYNKNPMAWIMKISKNLFLMHKRKGKNDILTDSAQFDAVNELPYDMISDTETRMFIQELFQVLNKEERDIIIMQNMFGFKFREIAESMNLSAGTVMSKHHRAMKKLKKAIQDIERKESE